MRIKQILLALVVISSYSCSHDLSLDRLGISLYLSSSGLSWRSIDTDLLETATKRLIYEECFGEGNSIRLNQSMCIYNNIAFCFNHGDECRIYDIISKQSLRSNPLPDKSHHNNAQFSHQYLDNDKYPLLILSRGDYPPNQNAFYVIRICEEDECFSFSVHKTIHNNIQEAKYGGSWVIDDINGMLYLYCMTTGDYRKTENNVFCVFSFPLPDITSTEDITLGYEDVIERWEFSYLVPQGGAYYNGYLLFNVQSLQSIEGKALANHKNVIAINTINGHVSFVLPLNDTKETEGICVFNDKLYVSFKNGRENQSPSDTVFSLYEYSLPTLLTKK